MSRVDEVFELIARRDLSKRIPAYEMAKAGLAATTGNELLALHEAIVESLSSLLKELGEHGWDNFVVYDRRDFDPATVDVSRWAGECAKSWDEVRRLRSAGAESSALIAAYVGDWMDPVGGRDWLNRMRNGVPYRNQPSEVEELSQRLAEEMPTPWPSDP